MKGTHWTGLILSMGMGCISKGSESTEDPDSWTDDVVESSADDGDDDEESDPSSEEEDEDDESGADGNLGGLDDSDSDGGGTDDGGGDDGGGDDGGSDYGSVEEDDEPLVLPSGLNGTRIDPPTPLVDFYAVNRDGSSRSMEDLMDGPTVLWFYPAADTYG